MPRFSDTALTGTYGDSGVMGEAPRTPQDLAAAQPSFVSSPLAPEPIPFTTHTEGDIAYLKDRDGKVVQVPRGLADRYANEQGYQPVDAVEVAAAKKDAPSAFGAAAKSYYSNLASSFVAPARAAVAGFDIVEGMLPEEAKAAMYAVNPLLAAMGHDEREDFVAANSPEQIRENFAGAVAGAGNIIHGRSDDDRIASAAEEARLSAQREAAAFPTLTGVMGTLGQVVGGLPYAAVGPSTGVARIAAYGAAEAGAYGALSEYDDAAMDGRPVNVENVINSGFTSAVIGGLATGALAGVGKMFRKTSQSVEDWSKETTRKEVVDRLNEAKKALSEATDDGSKFAAKTDIEASEFDAKVLDVMDKAGTNPELRKAAADKFIMEQLQEQKNALGELHPDDWERMAHPDMSGSKVILHAENAMTGATKALQTQMNKTLKGFNEVAEPLRSAKPKKEWVETNFAQDGDSLPDVFETVPAVAKRAEDGLRMMTEELGSINALKTPNAKWQLGQIKDSFTRFKNENLLARSRAEAYIALDNLRGDLHDMSKFLGQSAKSMQGGKLSEKKAAEIMAKHVKEAYLKTADDLGNEALFGKQGAGQKLVNGPGTGFVDLINSDRHMLRNFVEVVATDIDGREVFEVTKKKAYEYLKNLAEPTARDVEFHRVLQDRINLLESVKKGYSGLDPAQLKRLDEVIADAKETLRIADVAERAAIKKNRFERMMETEKAKGGMLPSRFLWSALGASAAGPLGAVAFNIPQFFRAGSAMMSGGGLRGAGAELAGGPEQLVRWAHSIRLRNIAGKHAMMSKVADALDWMADGNKTRVKTGGGAFKKRVSNALGKVAQTAETVAKYSPPMWGIHSESDKKDARKAVAKKAATLRQIARNPASLGDTAMGSLAYVSPDLYRAMTDELVRRVDIVQQNMPGKVRTSILGEEEQMSAQELRSAEMIQRVFENPLSVLDDMRHGYLNPDAVAVAHQVAPNTFQMARAAFVDLVSDPENEFKPSMNQLRQIDFVLGFGGTLDGSLEDAKMARLAQTEQEEPAQGAGGSRGPTKMVGNAVSQNTQSYSQQISQGATGEA